MSRDKSNPFGRPAPARAADGFTLTELLVVVGVIAILIALLMPVLGKVREQANRVRCAANLRSIGHALILYTQHYRYYPCFSSPMLVTTL